MMTLHPTKDVMKSGKLVTEHPEVAVSKRYRPLVRFVPKQGIAHTKARYRQYQRKVLPVPKQGTACTKARYDSGTCHSGKHLLKVLFITITL